MERISYSSTPVHAEFRSPLNTPVAVMNKPSVGIKTQSLTDGLFEQKVLVIPETPTTITPLPDFSYESTTLTPNLVAPNTENAEKIKIPDFALKHIPPPNERAKITGQRPDVSETTNHERQHAKVGEAQGNTVIKIELNRKGKSLARTYFAFHPDSATAAASGVDNQFGVHGTAGDEMVVALNGDSWATSVATAAQIINKDPDEIAAKETDIMAYMYLTTGTAIPGSMLDAINIRSWQELEMERQMEKYHLTYVDIYNFSHQEVETSRIQWLNEVNTVTLPDNYIRDDLINIDGNLFIQRDVFIGGQLQSEYTSIRCIICGMPLGSCNQAVHSQREQVYNEAKRPEFSNYFQTPTFTQSMDEISAQNAASVENVSVTEPIADYYSLTTDTATPFENKAVDNNDLVNNGSAVDIFTRAQDSETQSELSPDPAVSGSFGQPTLIKNTENPSGEESESRLSTANEKEPEANSQKTNIFLEGLQNPDEVTIYSFRRNTVSMF